MDRMTASRTRWLRLRIGSAAPACAVTAEIAQERSGPKAALSILRESATEVEQFGELILAQRAESGFEQASAWNRCHRSEQANASEQQQHFRIFFAPSPAQGRHKGLSH
jgi:hypothetical protein